MWDIEDLVNLGTSMSACPFFAAKALERKAELIFCPYNYLIEPGIRELMGICIDDAILIFDEAHNLEDSARDAATYQFTLSDLSDASRQLQLAMSTDDLASVLRGKENSRAQISSENESDSAGGYSAGPTEKELTKLTSWFQPIADVLHSLHGWLREASFSSLVQQEFEKMGNIWGSDAVLSLLQNINVTSANIEYLRSCLRQGLTEYELLFGIDGSKRSGAAALFTVQCLHFISGLMQVFEFILMEDMKFLGDYKLLMEKTPRKDFAPTASQSADLESGSWITSISFLCLRGAAGFRPLLNRARSIVLVSGTLAPFDGLRAELGLDKLTNNGLPHISLTTSHVLASDAQLSVVRIGQHNSAPLRVDYKNQERADFQDSIGNILVQLVGSIPDGVLIFLPSYATLERLSQRWKSNGIWTKLQAMKPLFCEPRASAATSSAPKARGDEQQQPSPDLQHVWRGFNKAITSGKGAVFFGVCRGKLSEGMDFQDEFARAVIVIGIPFAHVKSKSVQLKKEFNDFKSRNDDAFLSGSEWYALQAFRALNQSIGRVVRHRFDYGAVVLIDERFSAPQNELKLSSWVRRGLRAATDVSTAAGQLREFFPAASKAVESAKTSQRG